MANQSSLQCGRGPREIMSWTEELYKPVFSAMTHSGQAFALREHDYVFGDHKFGGSAQGSLCRLLPLPTPQRCGASLRQQHAHPLYHVSVLRYPWSFQRH